MRLLTTLALCCSVAFPLACGSRAELSDSSGGEHFGDDLDPEQGRLEPLSAGVADEADDVPALPSPSPVTPSTPPGKPSTPPNEPATPATPSTPPSVPPPPVPQPMEPQVDPPRPLEPPMMACAAQSDVNSAIEAALAEFPSLEAGPLLPELPPGEPGIALIGPIPGPFVLVFHRAEVFRSIYSYVNFSPDCVPSLFERYILRRNPDGCWEGQGNPPFDIPGPLPPCVTAPADQSVEFVGQFKTDCGMNSTGSYSGRAELVWTDANQGTLTFYEAPNARINGLALRAINAQGGVVTASFSEGTLQGDCRYERVVNATYSTSPQSISVSERLVGQCSNGVNLSCTWSSSSTVVRSTTE